MTRWSGLALLGSAALLAFGVSRVASQEKPNSPPGMPAMGEKEMAAMQEWMKLSAPSEHHKKLEPLVGKWNTATKIWMGGPGTPPMESSGTSESKWIHGGRYVLEEHKGQHMGMPHEGTGITGYDNFRNLYTSVWSDNMSTALLTMKGAADPSGKIFTFYGEMDEPGLKIAGRTVKYVTRIIDNDKHTFEIIDLHAGDNYKVIEISYTRVK